MEFTRRLLDAGRFPYRMAGDFVTEIAGFVPGRSEGWCYLVDNQMLSLAASAVKAPQGRAFLIDWYIGVYAERGGRYYCDPI